MKKLISLFLFILLIASFSPSCKSTIVICKNESPWPMFSHDEKHTGLSNYSLYGGSSHIIWKTWISNDNILYSSPVIDNNGIIYVGSGWDQKSIYSVNPNGSINWEYVTDGKIYSTPYVSENNKIIVGSTDGHLYSIKSNGTLNWKFLVGDWIYSSPVVDDNNSIYFGSTNYNFYSLYPNGSLKWKYTTENKIYSSPAIDDSNHIYFGSHDYHIYALYSNGTLKWRYKTNGEVKCSPTITSDGTILAGSWDGYIYALYPNGTLKWKNNIGTTESSPAINKNDFIFVGTDVGIIYCFDDNGNEQWNYVTEGNHLSSPSIDNNGIIYFSSDDGYLYALNSNGNLKWKKQIGGDLLSSVAIANNKIYFIGDEHLFSIEGGENSPPLKPNLHGQSNGIPGVEYEFSVITQDPDNDEVSYYFKWGDGTSSGWTDYIPSNIYLNQSHTWQIKGSYLIKVKAKDRLGAESDWGTFTIKIPKDSFIIQIIHSELLNNPNNDLFVNPSSSSYFRNNLCFSN